ncbi:PREDICTED: tetraspanin-18-like isoform X2 [Ipomoea nil]|uniref:tetraspanin-18-like isoform X1 n=1 Tax=Ipomoea nil TaxID=35883 RepID=UPI0009019499|nr:PREDICTED: tetraspanin-18-like isoform X1 [Ipomoea nil]XP_019178551.1 PREDICTED: tetraspanin-18-like isoform X2 [Ipomoea nil]
MATPCCHAFLAFVLKFLNFLQAFVGISIIVYSAYMLEQWQHHVAAAPLPSSSPSAHFAVAQLANFDSVRVSDGIASINSAFSGVGDGININSHSLPAPWFIYAFMGFGALLCCISFIGHVGAEAINGCCLCCYSLLMTVFVLLEASLVAFIALDHHWEADLPPDPTGELDSLRNFIEDNVDVCKWIGIVVIIVQASTLFLAIILRALVNQQVDNDIEGGNDARERTWEPLLDPCVSQTPGVAKGDGSAWHSDVWSSRMRFKYGFNREHSTSNQYT